MLERAHSREFQNAMAPDGTHWTHPSYAFVRVRNVVSTHSFHVEILHFFLSHKCLEGADRYTQKLFFFFSNAANSLHCNSERYLWEQRTFSWCGNVLEATIFILLNITSLLGARTYSLPPQLLAKLYRNPKTTPGLKKEKHVFVDDTASGGGNKLEWRLQ